MLIAAHSLKINRLMQTRACLDPAADFELWFWAGMNAGTHAFNAALHHAGLTREERAFAMQPGVYLVVRPDGTFVPELREAGDVLHVGRPIIEAVLPSDVQRMADAMERMEHYRDPCIREGLVPTPAIVETCAQALDECLRLLQERLAGDRHASA